jgi:hypothetical protein
VAGAVIEALFSLFVIMKKNRDKTINFLMDLAAVLKALRQARGVAAGVVQRATATLQQEQARIIERMGAETRRQQEALAQQRQQVVRQAARVQGWLPWKVALLLLVGTLLANTGAIAWWGWQLATERRELRQAIETIYRTYTLPSSSKRFP